MKRYSFATKGICKPSPVTSIGDVSHCSEGHGACEVRTYLDLKHLHADLADRIIFGMVKP
jgi:hypothetical protein